MRTASVYIALQPLFSCGKRRIYRPHPRNDRAEQLRIREIAATRIRYGARRIHVLLRREGWRINHKKTYRIYCEEGLNLQRKRPKRRVAAAHRHARPAASNLNSCWSMDFVADQLFNSQKIRALTVVDNFSRESLAITVDFALKAEDVVAIAACTSFAQNTSVDSDRQRTNCKWFSHRQATLILRRAIVCKNTFRCTQRPRASTL
ncbi:IS3 family transposase [Chromobacterium haemolyticum]|uniref:IS3 family transposase n=1 Tax=Chromobacterium haemolyticum TaxID=394935 RepID=UPI0009DA77FC|nr:hypothetical protein B0T39_24205 [Chromobacterium haemolyticum]